MKIEILRRIRLKELEERIRNVPLMKKADDGSDIMVYQDADISLKRLSPNEVNPTSFYLLRKNLEFQRGLREYLLSNFGIDSLNLEGALEILNERGEIWTLTPPIIEVTPRTVRYVSQEGEIDYSKTTVRIQIPIINDGIHRVAIARETSSEFNSLFISGALVEFPFYAHPNSWDMVKVVDEVPKTKGGKKLYSREDCYSLYRNFGVLGCGAPRHLGK